MTPAALETLYNFYRKEQDAYPSFFGCVCINALRIAEDVESILCIAFDRLYSLRNQLVHVGSTFNSSANCQQLKDACLLLSSLIPLFLKLMMANVNSHDWGKPFYPYIQEN